MPQKFKIGDRRYNIPDDKIGAFLTDFPDAVKLQAEPTSFMDFLSKNIREHPTLGHPFSPVATGSFLEVLGRSFGETVAEKTIPDKLTVPSIQRGGVPQTSEAAADVAKVAVTIGADPISYIAPPTAKALGGFDKLVRLFTPAKKLVKTSEKIASKVILRFTGREAGEAGIELGKKLKGSKEGIAQLRKLEAEAIREARAIRKSTELDPIAKLEAVGVSLKKKQMYREAREVATGKGGAAEYVAEQAKPLEQIAKGVEKKPFKTIKQPMGEKPSQTLGYNVEKMHPDLKEELPKIVENFRAEFNIMRGEQLTTNQAVDTAIKYAGNLTDEKVLQFRRGDVKNATELLGARIYTNNRMLEMGDKLLKLPKDASGKLIGDITAENKQILNMYMKVRALGTETARSLRFMRVPVSDKLINGLKNYTNAIKNIDPKSGKILEEILNDAEKLPRLRDKVVFWWYNSMLSNPFTDLANITGNTSHQLWEASTMAFSNPANIPQILKGVYRGVPKGFKEAAKIYRQETELLSKFTGKEIRRYDVYPKTKVGRFLRSTLPTTRLSMEDAIASTISREIRLGVGARKIAKAENISTNDVVKSIDSFLKDPQFKLPDGGDKVYRDLAEYLDKYAEYVTFRTPLKSTFAKGAQETLYVKPIVPFVRVMANIMKAGYKSSPIGFVKLFGKGAKNLTVFERQDIVRRAMAGTIFYSGVGSLMANGKVEVTGSGPDSKKERELWDKLGYKPNHIYYVKDNGQKKGISYQNINPFNVILAVMGNWQDQYRFGTKLISDEKSFMEKLSYALGGAAATMTDQSFMQGVSNFFNWIKYKDEKYLEDFVTKPFIPNIVGFKRNLEEYISGKKPRFNAITWWERVKRRVGLYEGLTPVYSAYGGQKESGYERFPFFPSVTKRDPMLEMFQKRNLGISVPSKNTKLGNRIMTPKEYSEYVRISGNGIMGLLRTNKSTIQRLDDEQAQNFIDKIIRKERQQAKQKIK